MLKARAYSSLLIDHAFSFASVAVTISSKAVAIFRPFGKCHNHGQFVHLTDHYIKYQLLLVIYLMWYAVEPAVFSSVKETFVYKRPIQFQD